MGYKALVNSNVNKAFDLVKDLADVITLTKKVSTSFDFNTGIASSTETAAIVTKAVVVEVNKKSKDRNTLYKNLMLKTLDVGDVANLDKVSLLGAEWKIGPLIFTNNYVTIVEIYRENLWESI